MALKMTPELSPPNGNVPTARTDVELVSRKLKEQARITRRDMANGRNNTRSDALQCSHGTGFLTSKARTVRVIRAVPDRTDYPVAEPAPRRPFPAIPRPLAERIGSESPFWPTPGLPNVS